MKNDKTLKDGYNYESAEKRTDCYCDPKMEKTDDVKKMRTGDFKTAKRQTETECKDPANCEFGTESFANPFTLTNNNYRNNSNKTNR